MPKMMQLYSSCPVVPCMLGHRGTIQITTVVVIIASTNLVHKQYNHEVMIEARHNDSTDFIGTGHIT